ncbi:hypothetical protein C8J56DRAFT_919115 [Mycena floridula]|nr:hypothetical protein C8J56DRAFT_919115 [Mycena floridula]
MSVATRNPFALLDADESSRPSSPAPAPAKETPSAAARDSTKPKGGPAARGGKYYQRGGAATKSGPREPAGNLNQNGVEEPVGKKFDGRGRGRGGARGGRGAGGGRGGRAFDKHSQTGKTDSDKKIHQSWGGDDGNAEFKTEEAATVDAAAEGAATDAWGSNDATDAADAWAAPAVEGEAQAAPAAADGDRGDRRRREREPEEEDNTLTLDQYLAQKKEQEESLVPKLESTRQANDGKESWKDVVPLQKTGEDEYFVGKGKAAPKARAKKEEKVFLEIEARFERPARGGPRGGPRGGERGARGAGRGRGGSDRPARGRGAGPTVDVDDQTAFPSLS